MANLVSKEIADLLKDYGFLECSPYYYNPEGNLVHDEECPDNEEVPEGCSVAPNQEQVKSWIQEVLKALIQVDRTSSGAYMWTVYKGRYMENINSGPEMPTYTEAFEDAVRFSLTSYGKKKRKKKS